MKNFNWCVYTYRHRRAFEYTAKKLIQDDAVLAEILKRSRTHDLDKMLLYLFIDDQRTAQQLHIDRNAHHLENELPRTYLDYVETVIDYECAPYTKPDKPLNAYDFSLKLMDLGIMDKKVGAKLMEIMHELGIDSSYDLTKDEEGMAYMASIGEVTEEMILFEVLEYVDRNRDNTMPLVREYMEKE